jgi:hypothetical protein
MATSGKKRQHPELQALWADTEVAALLGIHRSTLCT